jgi:hypothetical protein
VSVIGHDIVELIDIKKIKKSHMWSVDEHRDIMSRDCGICPVTGAPCVRICTLRGFELLYCYLVESHTARL